MQLLCRYVACSAGADNKLGGLVSALCMLRLRQMKKHLCTQKRALCEINSVLHINQTIQAPF